MSDIKVKLKDFTQYTLRTPSTCDVQLELELEHATRKTRFTV